MAAPDFCTWTVFLDGSTQQIAVTVERHRTAYRSWRYTVTLNGTQLASVVGRPKFTIGSHKCEIRTVGFISISYALEIDGYDASAFHPSRWHAAAAHHAQADAWAHYQHAQAQQAQAHAWAAWYAHQAAAAQPAREHVYERQVVVVRCRFCAVLTPVDFERCTRCGAERFS